MTLRRKLICAFLAVTVLPFVALLLGLPAPAIHQAEELVGGRLNDNVQQAAAAIDQFMINCIRDMKAFASDTVAHGYGTQLGDARINAYLDRLTYFYPYFKEFAFTNENGQILASSDSGGIGRSLFSLYPDVRPEFYEAIKGPQGPVYVTELRVPHGGSASEPAGDHDHHFSASSLQLHMLSAVYDESGKCVGVLSGILVTQHLLDLLADIDRRIPGGKHAMLLNSKGELLVANFHGDHMEADLADSAILMTQVGQDRKSTGFTTFRDSSGERIMSGYASMWSYGANRGGGWKLVASAPYGVIMRPVWMALTKAGIILLIAVTAAAGVAYWLAHALAQPVLKLTEGARKIAEGDLSARVEVATRDETGELAKSFNQMATTIQSQIAELHTVNESLETRVTDRTQELEKINSSLQEEVKFRKSAQELLLAAQSQLAETSRQAGMAEVATSVLHNVGNVLNSVNVTTTLVSDRILKSKAANIGKVAAMLEENKGDLATFITQDPKGRQLPAYLATLSTHLEQEQEILKDELKSLQKNVEHIKDIVAMQQSYAKVYGVTEMLAVSELVEDSLHLNAGALVRHEVDVIRDYEEIPAISVERHKVLQVLVNLIRNAKYACDEGGAPQKWIRIRIHQEEDFAVINITDNGIGIPAENMDRIFAHGFTTRDLGHGFGLHNSALVARELGGSLTAHSPGPGQGATFILKIPFTSNR